MISLNPPIPPAGGAAHHLDLPAGGLRKAGVHPEKIFREEPRLIPPRAGPDLEKDVLLIVRVPGQQKDPQPVRQGFQGLLQLGQFLPGQFLQLFVALPEERLILLDTEAGLLVFAEGLDQGVEIGMFLGILLIDPLLADDGRVAQELLQIPVTGFDILQS